MSDLESNLMSLSCCGRDGFWLFAKRMERGRFIRPQAEERFRLSCQF
jgi:hypothetical protein